MSDRDLRASLEASDSDSDPVSERSKQPSGVAHANHQAAMSLGSRDPGDRASESTERLNTVKFFDATKGFGFIKSLREIYFSASDVVGEVVAGDEVKFDLKDGRKGTVAVNVRRA